MDEGLFSLLFFGIFIVASIFDAVARSRRKKQRMEEMEQEESGAVAEADHGRPDEYAEREWEAPRREQAPWETPSGSTSERGPERAPEAATGSASGESRAGERETADAMVPEDLWAVLTGQEPRSSRSEGPTRADRPAEDPPTEPRIPAPVPSDRYGQARSPRWGSGQERPAAIGAAEIEDKARPQVRPAARAAGSMRRRAVSRLDDTISLHSPSRRQRSSRYVANLHGQGREGLREAVVLSEVLGSPLALRPRDGGWDGETR